MHDANDNLKKLQKEVELEDQKLRPLVKNLDCMYLITQLMKGHAMEYISKTKDLNGPSSYFL